MEQAAALANTSLRMRFMLPPGSVAISIGYEITSAQHAPEGQARQAVVPAPRANPKGEFSNYPAHQADFVPIDPTIRHNLPVAAAVDDAATPGTLRRSF